MSCLLHFLVLRGLYRGGVTRVEEVMDNVRRLGVPGCFVTFGVRPEWKVGGQVAFGEGGEEERRP